jgi:hypothetical protein
MRSLGQQLTLTQHNANASEDSSGISFHYLLPYPLQFLWQKSSYSKYNYLQYNDSQMIIITPLTHKCTKDQTSDPFSN